MVVSVMVPKTNWLIDSSDGPLVVLITLEQHVNYGPDNGFRCNLTGGEEGIHSAKVVWV